jgi:hypothetical protein
VAEANLFSDAGDGEFVICSRGDENQVSSYRRKNRGEIGSERTRVGERVHQHDRQAPISLIVQCPQILLHLFLINPLQDLHSFPTQPLHHRSLLMLLPIVPSSNALPVFGELDGARRGVRVGGVAKEGHSFRDLKDTGVEDGGTADVKVLWEGKVLVEVEGRRRGKRDERRSLDATGCRFPAGRRILQ